MKSGVAVVTLAFLLGCQTLGAQLTRDAESRSQHATVQRGEVLIRLVPGERIVVMVDTRSDKERDGVVDQWFTLQTEAVFAGPDWIRLPDAEVNYREGRLRVLDRAEKTIYEFALTDEEPGPVPDGFTSIRTQGFGLSRSTSAPEPEPSGTITCEAGGEGATSSALANGAPLGQTSCTSGYFACCTNLTSGGVLCKCYRNP